MDERFSRYLDFSGIPLRVAVQPLRAAAPIKLRPSKPSPDAFVRQPYVNDHLNSRLGVRSDLPGPLIEIWHANVRRDTGARWILATGDRIAVFGLSGWQILTMHGQEIKQGVLRHGVTAVDPERGLFYLPEFSGLLAARRLADGERVYAIELFSGKDFLRFFMARRGRFLISASTELPSDPDSPSPENTVIEVTDLGDPEHPKSYGESGGPKVTANLRAKTRISFAAVHDSAIVMTTQNGIFIADMDLKVQRGFSEAFSPLGMSIDEAGNIYLIARTKERTELWMLSQSGERYYVFQLPPGMSTAYCPVLGHDHTAYLLAGQSIMAVAMDGKLKWSRISAGNIAGAVIPADDRLLVSEGSEIALYSSAGERTRIHTFPGEALAGPPVLSPNGHLLAVTSTSMHCLAPRP